MCKEDKLIVRNTLFLYGRIGIIMLIGLYSSRILLQALGIESFGIYNVVGSIVMMFNSIRGMFVSSTQRFLNIEMGRHNEKGLNEIFCTSINIHIFMCVLFLLIVEPMGIWLIHNKLNIPDNNYFIVNVLFQLSILASILTILTIPYEAVLIASQRMHIYAYISILDAILKLCAIGVLFLLSSNRLLIYGILILLIAFINRGVSYKYCKQFSYCKYRNIKNKGLYKSLGSFAGWNFFGNLAFSLSNEGQNLLLNIFFGPALNAARGIAYQIRNALYQLTSNLNLAFAPQITHLYAKGKNLELTKVASAAIRLSVYTITICCIPVYTYIDEILTFWLTTIPLYTAEIIRCILIMVFLRAFAAINDTIIQATGQIKKYHIINAFITLFSFIGSYVYLTYFDNFIGIFWIYNFSLLISIINSLIIIYWIKIIEFKKYNTILIKCCIPCIPLLFLSFLFKKYFTGNVIIGIGLDTLICAMCILLFHTSKQEKKYILNILKNMTNKIRW